MIKVYQTIIDKKHGNCMQAVIASLFEKPLEEVPHFLEQESWFGSMWKYLNDNGYDYDGSLLNKYYNQIWQTKADCFNKPKYYYKHIITPKKLYKEEGVNGYFFASVLSPRHFSWGERDDSQHAVVIDRDYNIVHDPNPEYKDLYMYPLANLIRYNGIVNIYLINPKKKS